MFMLISNEPIKVADLQKLANQLMLNGALVTDLPVKTRKLWSFDKARNILIKTKLEIFKSSEKILGLTKYLSFSEVQKNSKVVSC